MSVREGPEQAVFEDWLGARADALVRFAYLVTGSQHAAEEAVQAAVATAFERWPQVSRTRDPDAYVRRMVVNAHVSRWRRFGRRELPVAEVYDAPGRAGAAGSWTGDHQERVAVAETVRRVCAALPVRQRAAVVLRYYEDRSFAEIAETLGCPESTARSHVHRGLAALRAELERQEAADD